MFNKLAKLAMTAGASASIFTGALVSAPKPASADTTSTLLTAAAAVGALVLYNNYAHKQQQANSIVGYTGNGGTIYGDGRIVMPNGQTVYPNANGQYPWGGYTYYNQNANPGQYTYDYNRTGQYDHTRRHWHTNNGNGRSHEDNGRRGQDENNR